MRILKKTLIAVVLVYARLWIKAIAVIVLQFLAANALKLRSRMFSVATQSCE